MPPRTQDHLHFRRGRRLAAERRRNRRVAASIAIPAVITGLAVLILWLGTGRSTTVEGNPAVPALGPGAKPPDIPVASAGQVQLRLPVDPDRVTAIAFHPVDDTRALTLRPTGPLPWHDMGDTGGRGRGGFDVGARAGTVVFSPVDGTVISRMPFVIRGGVKGLQFAIVPSSDPAVVVVINHVEKAMGSPTPKVGETVRAGTTPLGQVPAMSDVVTQPISQFSADEGDHVSILVTRPASG